MTPEQAARLAALIAEHTAGCYCPRCAEYRVALLNSGYDETGRPVAAEVER